MRSLDCLRIGALLDRRRGTLSDAERLLIERHLEQCADCASTSSIVTLVRELAEDAAELAKSPSPKSYERAIDRAFEAVARPRNERATGFARRGQRGLWATAAAAAVIGIAALYGLVGPPAAREASGKSDPAIDRVLSGDIRAEGRSLAFNQELPGALLSSEEGGTIALGPARVELSAGTAVSWDSHTSTVRLRSGVIDVAVEPPLDSAFRAATDRFVVEVVGTAFRVDPGGVQVTRGRVRVSDTDGNALVPDLRAGESWRYAEAVQAPSRAPDGAETEAAGVTVPSGRMVRATRSVDSFLEEARRALMDGNVPSARHMRALHLRERDE